MFIRTCTSILSMKFQLFMNNWEPRPGLSPFYSSIRFLCNVPLISNLLSDGLEILDYGLAFFLPIYPCCHPYLDFSSCIAMHHDLPSRLCDQLLHPSITPCLSHSTSLAWPLRSHLLPAGGAARGRLIIPLRPVSLTLLIRTMDYYILTLPILSYDMVRLSFPSMTTLCYDRLR